MELELRAAAAEMEAAESQARQQQFADATLTAKNVIKTSARFERRRSPTLECDGLFATKKIERGTCIISEASAMRWSATANYIDQWRALSPKQRKNFWQLGLTFADVVQIDEADEDAETKKFANFWKSTVSNDLCYKDAQKPKRWHYHGLFLTAAHINHSCRPNAINFDDKEQDAQKIFAFRDIQEGEEITVSYLTLANAGREMRQKWLLKRYNFYCRCSLCTADDDVVLKSDMNRFTVAVLSDQLMTMGDFAAEYQEATGTDYFSMTAEELDSVVEVDFGMRQGQDLVAMIYICTNTARAVGIVNLQYTITTEGRLFITDVMRRMAWLVITLCDQEGIADAILYKAYMVVGQFAMCRLRERQTVPAGAVAHYVLSLWKKWLTTCFGGKHDGVRKVDRYLEITEIWMKSEGCDMSQRGQQTLSLEELFPVEDDPEGATVRDDSRRGWPMGLYIIPDEEEFQEHFRRPIIVHAPQDTETGEENAGENAEENTGENAGENAGEENDGGVEEDRSTDAGDPVTKGNDEDNRTESTERDEASTMITWMGVDWEEYQLKAEKHETGLSILEMR